MERKFHGSESYLYGLFAPGNESAEERKGLESLLRPELLYTNLGQSDGQCFNRRTRTMIKKQSNRNMIKSLLNNT